MSAKIYTLKISLDKKIFRIIEIKGNTSLYNLAKVIVKSFDFDFDHAFGFYSNHKNVYDSDERYELFTDLPDCDSTENAKGVEGTTIDSVFTIKKQMTFVFDYGDWWTFLIECKNILDPIKYPRVIEKIGKAPEQYPTYNE